MIVWNGRLPGATRFGFAGSRREAVAAVLQRDARAGHDHARAEAQVVALDEADHHAVAVGRGEVDGAAARRRPGRTGRARARRSGARALASVGLVEQAAAPALDVLACRRRSA